jgi:hypothetical protein
MRRIAAILLTVIVLAACDSAPPPHGEPGHDHETMHSQAVPAGTGDQ